jgi:hypothetical protein
MSLSDVPYACVFVTKDVSERVGWCGWCSHLGTVTPGVISKPSRKKTDGTHVSGILFFNVFGFGLLRWYCVVNLTTYMRHGVVPYRKMNPW